MSEELLDIPKQFDHREAEGRIYSFWEKENIFKAVVDPTKPAFCVVIPPPNVTGILHMGHVLDNVPQDVMTRWHRMRGFSAVWIPGTDHAGIATQNVVGKKLAKEGVDYKSLGREKFIEHVWEWKQKHGNIIINQLKRLGCSCDWSRERFTMDEGFSRAVLTAFLRYYEKGLIYRGKRMINWCCVCGTALSDDEVPFDERHGNLWHIRYPILDGAGKPTADFVTVATTRPETMLGDSAVAVHPDDERYKHIHGKKVLLPIQNRAIPVIADSFVDPSFGTGVVKVTPAHDPNDYQAGLTHKLELIVVIGADGTMTAAAGSEYQGLTREKARSKVVADLEASGALEKTEKHKHAVGTCYRCQSVVEPRVSDQWFVKMRPLAEKAKQVVLDGRLKIVPNSERNDYFDWMDRIQDWCISRQLWWGHRIPVYYCGGCDHMEAALEMPKKCSACGGTEFKQDEDVLDTWFSSQLWPFGTLGWPDKTPDLNYWFPNSWLMSGRDILFFWDARMIMSALELMGDVPFRSLALHGLVRDDQGRKLSKSLGNSPDPLELFDQYGTDAIRGSIALHYPMGRQDTRLGTQVFERGQGFITKLWNATRLLLMNLEGEKLDRALPKTLAMRLEDRWIISRLHDTVKRHDAYLANSDFSHALETVWNFFWSEYCDWYLEIIKPRVREKGESRSEALKTVFAVHCQLLKLFHPYCPFITEELWQTLLNKGITDSSQKNPERVLALAAWPDANLIPQDAATDLAMETVMSVVRAVRDVRQNLLISPKQELRARMSFFEFAEQSSFAQNQHIACQLANLGKPEFTGDRSVPKGSVPFRFKGGIGSVEVPSDIDVSDIRNKLGARIAKLDKALAGIHQKLNNGSFVQHAPAELVEETKRQAKELEDSIGSLKEFEKSL